MDKWLSPLKHVSGSYRRSWRSPKHRGKTIVIMYHRIAAAKGRGEPPGFGVERGTPVDDFERQIRFLLKHFTPVRAAEVLAQADDTSRPAFAITFDDGYADNLSLAAPVLKALGVPATIYLSTDFVGSDRCFWWEQLGNLLRESPERRIAIRDVAPSLQDGWEIADDLDLATPERRERAHWLISMALMRTPPAEIDGVLRDLSQALKVSLRSEGRAAPMLDWSQVRTLRSFGFDICAHGRTHANLGLLPPDEAEREVGQSIHKVAEETDQVVETFAYPYGGLEHRSEAAIRAVERAGCRAAFTTDWGAVSAASNPLALPRSGFTRPWRFVWAHQIDSTLSREREGA